MANYATKSDLKSATGINASTFAQEADLTSLESDFNELHIDKLKPVPVDLYKLNNQ